MQRSRSPVTILGAFCLFIVAALALGLPAWAGVVRPTDPRLLPGALRLGFASVTVVRNALPALCGATVVVTLKNVSTRPVIFYLDLCGVCYWFVSVDGAPFQPAWKSAHHTPCRHCSLVTLPPGASRRVTLALELQGQGSGMRVAYQAGEVGSFLPLLVSEPTALP